MRPHVRSTVLAVGVLASSVLGVVGLSTAQAAPHQAARGAVAVAHRSSHHAPRIDVYVNQCSYGHVVLHGSVATYDRATKAYVPAANTVVSIDQRPHRGEAPWTLAFLIHGTPADVTTGDDGSLRVNLAPYSTSTDLRVRLADGSTSATVSPVPVPPGDFC